jgi:hypothetical protein
VGRRNQHGQSTHQGFVTKSHPSFIDRAMAIGYHFTRSFDLLAHDPRHAGVGLDGHLGRPVDVLGALLLERHLQVLVLVLNLPRRFGMPSGQRTVRMCVCVSEMNM